MEESKHDQIMTKLTKVFADENLKIGEAIPMWYSLGTFLFSHVDKEHKTQEKVHEAMEQYLATVKKVESENK